jgi:hypothetical protein
MLSVVLIEPGGGREDQKASSEAKGQCQIITEIDCKLWPALPWQFWGVLWASRIEYVGAPVLESEVF